MTTNDRSVRRVPLQGLPLEDQVKILEREAQVLGVPESELERARSCRTDHARYLRLRRLIAKQWKGDQDRSS